MNQRDPFSPPGGARVFVDVVELKCNKHIVANLIREVAQLGKRMYVLVESLWPLALGSRPGCAA